MSGRYQGACNPRLMLGMRGFLCLTNQLLDRQCISMGGVVSERFCLYTVQFSLGILCQYYLKTHACFTNQILKTLSLISSNSK